MRLRAVVLALAIADPARAGSVVEDVMARMARLPPRAADFVERKTFHALTVPLESSGRLAFIPPSRLEKDTLAPRRERLVIDGDVLTVTQDGTERQVGLDDSPALRLLADTLRAVLSGDLASLRGLYELEERGDAAAWQLLMVPRAAAARRSLARVTVDGGADDVRRIVVQQANGDEDSVTVTPMR